jgi:hypothetical protein
VGKVDSVPLLQLGVCCEYVQGLVDVSIVGGTGLALLWLSVGEAGSQVRSSTGANMCVLPGVLALDEERLPWRTSWVGFVCGSSRSAPLQLLLLTARAD